MGTMKPIPPRPLLPILPYRKPTPGRDYWVVDDVLPDPDGVRARFLAKTDWSQGYPYKPESWPGQRAMPGLSDEELAIVETRVREALGATRLWVGAAPDGQTLNHNCVQVVGIDECEPRPHTDSRTMCRYAAVLYLNPSVPDHCGTGFYRQRLGNGQRGGNTVSPPHANLVEALGTRFVAPDAFVEDVVVPHRYNRLLLYRANLIHSASGYWGRTLDTMRMAAVFFWMV
ncbi:hypothetical protein LC55x_3023 [Lysobacter capsici]|uniref:Prolyl 4-hydroxylase alpha subunit Fe(2+) 2OG dioxygenase domain-containing protein n=2 Tax=Lysobacter capsici TaxID=435897 RepID=A0A108U4V6_9GAMM|nr:hypothetical protein LC55x_3023 [Lysobacter capsici]KWS02596.1 hypothetical protein AZ78_0140 [Lysobacter capsici AZ78]